jgi:hypothetical protein
MSPGMNGRSRSIAGLGDGDAAGVGLLAAGLADSGTADGEAAESGGLPPHAAASIARRPMTSHRWPTRGGSRLTRTAFFDLIHILVTMCSRPYRSPRARRALRAVFIERPAAVGQRRGAQLGTARLRPAARRWTLHSS